MCHIDLGLYYLKLIRWTQTFPIVPGLVNVQEQLAFNQNAFLITSLFDSLVPNRWGIFPIAGFLPWLGLSLSVFAIIRLLLLRFWKQRKRPHIEIAYAISLPAWLSTLATFSLSSASPDCIISCLSIHFFLVFACYVVSDDEKPEGRAVCGEILLLGVLCRYRQVQQSWPRGRSLAVGFTVALHERKRQTTSNFSREAGRRHVGFGGRHFCHLDGRGILLSGYPLFPSTALAMPVPWRMPTKEIIEFQQEIVRWARDPDAGFGSEESTQDMAMVSGLV